MEPTSQQKLKQRLDEGKISRQKYDELISSLDELEMKRLVLAAGFQQDASKKRIYKYLLLILTAVVLPVGLCLNTSIVLHLSLVGICVVIFLYFRLSSWD